MNLADVMQECAGEEQIAIDGLRVIAAGQVAQLEQRDYVVQQSSDESMMQRLGCGSVFISVLDFGIGHESAHQRLQMRITEAIYKILNRLPKLADVLGGAGQVVGIINF